MKDTLRTRLEFLWAKIAGRDVDIDTLTPDSPTNMVEKLINTEVKKRKAITLPTDEEMAEELIDVLEDVYDEADLEPVS